MFRKAPFSEKEVRNINQYQKNRAERPLACSCGGILYGREDGIVCPKCHEVTESCVQYITSGAWSALKRDRV